MQQRQLDDATADNRALFSPIDNVGSSSWRVEATDYARGPWRHDMLHGGPVCGLAAWAAERLGSSDGLTCSRLTVELLTGIPQAVLTVSATVAKPGRRARLVDVEIRDDDRLVARATSQWLMPSPGWNTEQSEPTPPRTAQAADPSAADFDYPRPGFNCDAAEFRYVSGSNEESGPGVIWARLTSPLMAGEPTSPFVAVATLSDLAAAVGWETGPDEASYINPDVTLQLANPPRGNWIALDARLHRVAKGLGYIQAELHDDDGVIGWVLQSMVESPMILDTGAAT